MPAKVFDKEHKELDFSRGLYWSYSNTDRKPDYLSDAENVEYLPDKRLVPREDLVLESQFTKADTPNIAVATNQPPRGVFANKYEVFQATGGGTATPSMLCCYDDGTTRTIYWLDSSGTTGVGGTKTQSISRGVKAFCQYKNAYYASNNASNIFKITNWNAGASPPALTVTDLATTTAGFHVAFLVAFKNRIFGCSSSGRIYFTDLPALGGLPETWNITTNFFDLPTTDYSVTVYNFKVFKDKIYIFTNRGIFYLAVSGDPTQWVIQLVTADYSISHKEGMCISQNLVFLTDQRAIYAFNGSQFTEVTQNMRGMFAITQNGGYNVVSIYPYKNGILACRQPLINSGGIYIQTLGVTMWYFDIATWTQISTLGDVPRGVFAAGNNWIPYIGKVASSYIYYFTVANNDIKDCVYLDPKKYEGDSFNLDHTQPRTNMTISVIGPYFNWDNQAFSRIFEVYVVSPIKVDNNSTLNLQDLTISPGLGSPNNTVAQIHRSSYKKSSNIATYNDAADTFRLTGSVRGSVSPYFEPHFQLSKVVMVLNSDNRDRTEQFDA